MWSRHHRCRDERWQQTKGTGRRPISAVGQEIVALDRYLRGSDFQQYLRECFWCKEERLEAISPHRRFATGIHSPAVVRFEACFSDVYQIDA